MLPEAKSSLLLVVNADSYENEEEILNVVDKICQYSRIRSRNVTKDSLSLAMEVKVKEQKELIGQLMEIGSVTLASLVEHDGDITV